MAKQTINVGNSVNDRTGDSIRAAFQKVNANFTELYTALGLNADTNLNLGAFEFTGSTISTTDSSSITIDQATTVTSDLTVGGDILPSMANGGNLGSLARPFKSLYVSDQTVFFGGVPLSLDPVTNELKVNNVPISQTITYADIPNVPTDVSDLTDTEGLLGGGGGAANTGDITFAATTISAPNEDEIVIQSKDSNGFGTARVTLNSEYGGDVRLRAFSSESVDTFTLANGDFATGVWQDNGFGNGVVSFTGAQGIGDFFQNTLQNLTADNVSIVINNEPSFIWNGGASGSGTDTPGFGTNPIVPPTPITITSIQFRYRSESFISVNYDNQEIRLNAQNAGIRMDSSNDFQVFGDSRIELQSATGMSFSAGEDIDISTNSSFAARISAGDITLSAFDDVRIEGTDSFRLINSSTTAPIRIITNDDDTPRTWAFSPNGSLTFPDATVQNTAFTGVADIARNIESEDAVEIKVNLTDSTQRVWRFGEDGELTLAGPITNLRTNEGKIALGFESGLTNQGGGTVAVGQYSGRLNQGGSGVAVGGLAGNTDQGASAVAVGALAGGTNQGVAAVAVGALAGGGDQGQGAVAVGQLAGGLRQGEFAIAIGTSAGVTDQPANSIVLNASGLQLNGSAAGFYVDPIRNIEGGAFLNYNTSTKELGWSNDISSEGDISVNINLSDSTQRTWRFGEDGDLTFPNGQQIAAEDSNELLIGSPDAGLILNSQTRSSRLIAKKTFDREFNDNPDYTFSATVGPPHTITVTFSIGSGLYLLELLSRLASKFNGATDFRFDYSNIRIVVNPYAEAISANILAVGDTSGTTWDITIDQDPTAVVGNVTDIQILYDYNNTIGLDVGEDMFGIATDNDDIDIRSGRDIDLIAADDITFRAGSTFDLTLLQNDYQAPDDGLEIITQSSTLTSIWKFRFDGHLHIPGNIIGTNGISITPENAETYAYLNLPSDANSSSQGVAIGNDNGKIELRTTDQGTASSYVWKFDNDGSLTTPGGYIKPDSTDGFLTIEGPLYADMVQEEGGGVRTITNGVKIRTHRAFDDIDRDWNFSWDGAIYAPRDASNNQVGAIEWRTGDVTSQVRRTEGGTLLSGRVVPPGLMLFSNNTGAVSVLTGNSNYWTFEVDGDLTLPGGIRSEGNINIDINLSDSTLRRWSFGEDGNLTFPDSTVQTTAYTGPQTTLDGDVTGSVFADDSTLLVDGVNGKIVGDVETARLRTTDSSIVLGIAAGETNQGVNTIAIGAAAGQANQGTSSIAIGGQAGNTAQGVSAVALGAQAGATNQGAIAVSLGTQAGSTNQGLGAVAVGTQAGIISQGNYAVALGYLAGANNQPANSIVINASGSGLDGSAAGFYVNPVRNITGTSILQYNATTDEITHSNEISSEEDISIRINLSDSTQRVWRFGEDGILTLPAGGDIQDSTGTSVLGGGGSGSVLEEPFESKTTATGVVTHDATTNRLFYHTSISANFTANFTNLGLAANEATSISLVLVQGATARMVTAVQIGGAAQTIIWQGSASAPLGNANRTDVVTFSILCTATDTYTVLGMLTSFGG